jgi:N-methylhydantoinase A
MENEAKGYLPEEGKNFCTYTRSADLRYVGQDYEINVPISGETFSNLTKENMSQMFNEVYRSTYGRVYPDSQIEFINLRVIAKIPRPRLKMKRVKKGRISHVPAIKGKRKAYSSYKNTYDEFTVFDHSLLLPGMIFKGPAILEEKESTTVMDHHTCGEFDEYGNLVITLKTHKGE